MKKTLLILLIPCLLLLACHHDKSKETIDKSKQEIVATEKAFAAMAKKDGLGPAFGWYAAEDAAVNYNDKLLKGRSEIKEHYSGKKYQNVSLDWSPDFVDASASGDMGYTYGNYTFIRKDSTGKTETFKGIFHTVWKKQADGTWRFVWD
jgi:ketosteroid isomerase-like protein